ncbi:hypothetical protein N7474_000306 [Penicillium riverlandense]|uniref:uncharacterized protein n=1 Tax=Penicillium riverlandense TaxID=1903569 RepID=UPI002548BD8E|nr:uncharacterized protein N7474_000306 [Penicillium riverlandense]KAJ5831995.1 hypothetical protein N7474_000306 [Penicillium riverlandense]
MAAHQIAIAKAAFSAGLLRPDPTSVPRDDIAAFHASLDRVLSQCTPANIQTCKAWLLHYVASSSSRVGGLAKYLVALAGSFAEATKPSAKRRRLHILYLLNDLLHHSKYHLDTMATFSTVSGTLQPYLVDLVGHAAAYDRKKHPRHHRRLDDLLDIWSEHGYFSSDYVQKLRVVVQNSASSEAPPSYSEDRAGDTIPKPPGKDAPFVMPSTHGDPSTPYYDLPAGNLIPHIIPNSAIPLRPESIKPLQFLAGPADATLIHALKDFLEDVDRIYGTDDLAKEDGEEDIDELGQAVLRDEITGDIIDGETYYGWSRTFCQQMKKTHDDSRSRSGSLSGTRNNHKRRRYSDSSVSNRSDSRSRSRSRRDQTRRRYDSRSRSRESSYSPREPSPPRFPPPHQPSHPTIHGHPPPPPPHSGFPPPPPNFHGTWPPPPPPHMPGMPYPPGMNMNMNPGVYPPFPPHHSMPMAPGQPLPPGQSHFPPPHQPPAQHGPPWDAAAGRKNWR